MDGTSIDRFHWNLARVFIGIVGGWAILGVCSNSLILLTTLKTRTLRRTYNILIAVCAVADILHIVGFSYLCTLNSTKSQAAIFVNIPLLLNTYIEFDSDFCVLIMFLPQMGVATGCMCVLCVGVDRMLAVTFSVQYRMINKRSYQLFYTSLIFGFCCFLTTVMVKFRRHSYGVCNLMTPYPDEGSTWFLASIFAINTLNSSEMRGIIRSLFIIVTVDVSGWLLTPGCFIIFHFRNLDSIQMFAWKYFAPIFIHIALSVKLFIYYFTSCEYRSAFNAFLFKNSVVHMKQSEASVSRAPV